MIRDLLESVGFLAPIGAGVALLWLLGRDQDVDEHTVDDYRPDPVDAATADVDAVLDVVGPPVRRRLRPRAALDVLPPAPPGMRVSLPLYAEQVVAEQLRARYGTTDPDAIAGRMLAEIAADEDAKAGIGPDGHAWQLDGSCWSDCPACARDLTGAFPVLAVAR